MKKTIIITLLFCGLLGVTSCKNLTWSQIQTQITSVITLDSSVAIIVTNILEKYPESADLFRKISDDILKLSEKEVLTLDDIKADISRRIGDSDVPCKTDILLAMDKIFDKISTDPQFNVGEHKQELIEIVSGIDWALKMYEEKHASQEVTIGK